MIAPATAVLACLQAGVVGLLALAVHRRDVAAAVNGAAAVVLALLPAAAEALLGLLGREVAFGVALPLWLAAAGLLHSVGMLGWYESRWWWDHLTHTVSAALVAAVAYAGALVAFGTGRAAAVAVVATLAIGVCWELLELLAREIGDRAGVEPVLVYYGPRDTALDLVFDVLGALVVVGLDLRVFVPVVAQFAGTAEPVVVGGGGAVVAGAIATSLYVLGRNL
jgi:hypothetical protein